MKKNKKANKNKHQQNIFDDVYNDQCEYKKSVLHAEKQYGKTKASYKKMSYDEKHEDKMDLGGCDTHYDDYT